MGFFGNATDASIQEEVEKATSDKLVEDDWGMIMSICDKAGKSSDDAKGWLRAIVKRLYNSDPHVGIKAVTLLDACIKNSNKTFHIEVASRDFENDFNKLMTKAHPHVSKKLRESLKRWAENEFKSDGQLSLIPSLYHKLRSSYDFSLSETPIKKSTPKSTDPNVVETQEEEEQILKAIELSLKETSGSPRSTTVPNSSLYPSVNNMSALSSNTTNSAPAKDIRKVRALYDFEAAEDNELTFSSGEIIVVLDDTDPNWWKGSNQRGEGLFPANFVTTDLMAEPEKILLEKTKKMVQFKEEVKVLEKDPQEIEVNEEKIDRLLHLLHEADPTNPETDTDELLNLEREVNAMGPLIDSELERVDRKHAQLTQLSSDLVEALSLYHTLMREPQLSTIGKGGFDPTYGYIPPPSGAMYNGPPIGMPQMPQAIGYPLPGPPGLPPGVQERLPYLQQMHQYPINTISQAHGMPHGSQVGMITMPPPGMSNIPPGMPNLPPPGMSGNQQGGIPPNFQPMMDDSRMDVGVLPQFQQNMPPNFRIPTMSHATFPNSGPVSQTTLQNGPAQQPHFASSSTHIMH